MMGDYEGSKGDTVQNLQLYLQNHGCAKAICACNNSLGQAIGYIANLNHVFIDKAVTTSKKEQRVRNGEDAEKIYKLI